MNIQLLTILIKDAKLRLRLHTDAFDDEISDLVESAALDLIHRNAIQQAQLETVEIDPLIKRAILTFVSAHFGSNEDAERLKADYDEQKSTLMMTSGYTQWTDQT